MAMMTVAAAMTMATRAETNDDDYRHNGADQKDHSQQDEPLARTRHKRIEARILDLCQQNRREGPGCGAMVNFLFATDIGIGSFAQAGTVLWRKCIN